jgi:hypothetical protein
VTDFEFDARPVADAAFVRDQADWIAGRAQSLEGPGAARATETLFARGRRCAST